MGGNRYQRLVARGLVTADLIEKLGAEAAAAGTSTEDLLLQQGVPKHEILASLASAYNCPFIEYDEGIAASQDLTRRLDLQRLKKALWMPLEVQGRQATVVACTPDDPALIEDIRTTLSVKDICFLVTLPHDLVRIVEHNQDLNAQFIPTAGRTPLAKVRTYLANRRTLLASYRTTLSRGRTGLAFLRTGISLVGMSLLFYRIFGGGYLLVFEILLFLAGLAMTVDGFIWYLPARWVGRKEVDCTATEATWGTTVLEVRDPENNPTFVRSAPMPGSAEQRADWSTLTPVMRRRYLASDRTDMAEERTYLAGYRTLMAKARTGLAFARSGNAYVGLGIGLIRQFHAGPWTFFDGGLILIGVLMILEGFYWYFPGRKAGLQGLVAVKGVLQKNTIWDFVLPGAPFRPLFKESLPDPLFREKGFAPGIWATTGLALERTLLADRRGVMARLRTIMARARTGLAFIRTGLSISAVGLGLLLYFGLGNWAWTVFNVCMTALGLILVADGLGWYLPAERYKKQFPYCFGDMEIVIPDYGKPVLEWGRVIFENEAD